MSFKIPGYFLDQKTKKLYRIQPHGPFSLPELRKRVERERAREGTFLPLNEQIRPKPIPNCLKKRDSDLSRHGTLSDCHVLLRSCYGHPCYKKCATHGPSRRQRFLLQPPLSSCCPRRTVAGETPPPYHQLGRVEDLFLPRPGSGCPSDHWLLGTHEHVWRSQE